MRWITRERPKIDRVATAWLVTRFIDPEAEFFFAPADEVLTRAAALEATPYDIDGVTLSHRADHCTFDTMLADYQIGDAALHELAVMVRGTDTDRLDLSPQAPGLLAISLGLSRLCIDDDQRMMAHGFLLYDALYEWVRHARTERHGWDPTRVGGVGELAWDTIASGNLVIHLGARRAFAGGVAVDLGPKEFALLVALVARAGRVLSRGFLLQHVWAYEPDVASRTVDWHVAVLRKRLGDSGAAITTVRGGGYRWDGGAPG